MSGVERCRRRAPNRAERRPTLPKAKRHRIRKSRHGRSGAPVPRYGKHLQKARPAFAITNSRSVALELHEVFEFEFFRNQLSTPLRGEPRLYMLSSMNTTLRDFMDSREAAIKEQIKALRAEMAEIKVARQALSALGCGRGRRSRDGW